MGWGSLIWDTQPKFSAFIDQCGPWLRGGPRLPLEFSRISDSRSGALTLVIDPEYGTECSVSYCVSARDLSPDAVEDLWVREGPTRKEWIGSFRDPFEHCSYFQAIQAWAWNHGFDDVVWTALPPDFQAARKPFSVDVSYIQGLDIENATLARKYIKRAPEFAQTPVRRALQRFVKMGDQTP